MKGMSYTLLPVEKKRKEPLAAITLPLDVSFRLCTISQVCPPALTSVWLRNMSQLPKADLLSE